MIKGKAMASSMDAPDVLRIVAPKEKLSTCIAILNSDARYR